MTDTETKEKRGSGTVGKKIVVALKEIREQANNDTLEYTIQKHNIGYYPAMDEYSSGGYEYEDLVSPNMHPGLLIRYSNAIQFPWCRIRCKLSGQKELGHVPAPWLQKWLAGAAVVGMVQRQKRREWLAWCNGREVQRRRDIAAIVDDEEG